MANDEEKNINDCCDDDIVHSGAVERVKAAMPDEDALYDAAAGAANANQADLMAGELAEFNSRGNTIYNNDYNSNARRFNQDLGGQPARLIGALWGIEPAEYYE